MLPKNLSHALLTLRHLCLDFIRFFCNLLKPRFSLTAENLFLRKQLAILCLPKTPSRLKILRLQDRIDSLSIHA